MRARLSRSLLLLAGLIAAATFGQVPPVTPSEAEVLTSKGMHEMRAYSLLAELCNGVGPRMAGSKGADKAVEWGMVTMRGMGLQNVRKVPCTVRHWVRGAPESLSLLSNGRSVRLATCALGNSVATPKGGLTAQVIEVHSLEEIANLGASAKGKIVLVNGPMDPTALDTFTAYGRAVGQRVNSAAAAAKVGAVGVLVRSMTLATDDVPHTGGMRYAADVPKIPAAAVSTVAANRLSEAIRKDPDARVKLTMHCQSLPDAPSASIVGEIVGSELPQEVIVLGGHLDSWDITPGAHDDGSGIVQSLDAVRLIRELGWKPKRTIRVVLYMNEENGGEGGRAVAEAMRVAGETAYAAIESDRGGFAPRAFGTSLDAAGTQALSEWTPALAQFGIERIVAGGSTGADIEPLAALGAIRFGLIPDSQRYFDYHHARNDTIDKVNSRELQLGALSMAYLAWRLAQR